MEIIADIDRLRRKTVVANSRGQLKARFDDNALILYTLYVSLNSIDQSNYVNKYNTKMA